MVPTETSPVPFANKGIPASPATFPPIVLEDDVPVVFELDSGVPIISKTLIQMSSDFLTPAPVT